MNSLINSTSAPSAATKMEFGGGEAQSVSYAYENVLNDVKSLAASGNTSYMPNSKFANDLDSALASTNELTQRYWGTGNEINSSAYQFLNAAGAQLTTLQSEAQSGQQVLQPIATLAANVVEALSPIVSPQSSGVATRAPGVGVTRSPTVGLSSPGGNPAFSAASQDLSAEHTATSTAAKANDVQNAIGNLLSGIGGGDAVSGAPTATTTPSGGSGIVSSAPATSAALPQNVATDALTSLDLLSQFASGVGAPGSVQDSIANLVGNIEAMYAGNNSNGSYRTVSNANGGNTNIGSRTGINTGSGSSIGQDAATLLQGFQGIINQLKPYFSKTSAAGTQVIDSVAKVVTDIEALSSPSGVVQTA